MREHPTPKRATPSKSSVLIRILTVLAVLAAGAIIAMALMKSGPKTKRKPPQRSARLVEVQSLRYSNHPVRVEGMGIVLPAREITLFPQVSGKIRWVSPALLPGGRFRSGEAIVRIDSSDYELVVRQRAGDLQQAESNLKLEQGQQSIALSEFELLGETIPEEDRDLVLRLPQLQSVRAEVAKAQSALERAQLDLQRTEVKAPFNAIVKTRAVDLGESVGPATRLATLVGTDAYWVEVLIPVKQLEWIALPGEKEISPGAAVRIYNDAAWGSEIYRSGTVLGLASDLEEQGRMARLLISVPDPLGTASDGKPLPLLLIGAFVRAEIEGRPLERVAAIDRRFFREGEAVWVMNAKDQLEIRPVKVAFRDRDQVYLSAGVREGERLVLTDLAAPVEGMPLRTEGDLAKREGGSSPESKPSEKTPSEKKANEEKEKE